MKDKPNLTNSNIEFYDCEQDSIETPLTTKGMIEMGRDLYKGGAYQEALDAFKKVKDLDAKSPYIHYPDYYSGKIYIKLAEREQDDTQKKFFYKEAAGYFKSFLKIYRTPYSVDFGDINERISKALYNAGNKEEALPYLKDTQSYKLANEIEQKLTMVSTTALSKSCNFGSPAANNEEIFGSRSQQLPPNFKISNTISREDIIEITQYFGQEINNLKTQVNILAEACHYAGVFEMGSINKAITKLQQKYPDLYKYYNEFKCTLKATMDACENISTGLIVADAGHIERKSAVAATKLLCYVLDLIAIGRFSGILTLLHDAGDNAYNTNSEDNLLKKLSSLFTILKSKFNNSYFKEIEIQKMALYFTFLQQYNISNIENINLQENTENSLKEIISKKFTTFKAVMHKYFKGSTISKETDAISKLAFEDVGALLNYLYEHHESINSNKIPLTQQISQAVTTGELSKLWLEKISALKIEDVAKNNGLAPIEGDMLGVRKNLLDDISTIQKKILEGKWENTERALIETTWRKLPLIPISIPTGAKGSFSKIERGVEEFITEKYYQELCSKKGVECNEEDIANFKLFMFREICDRKTRNITEEKKKTEEESKSELLIQNYIAKYPGIISQVLEKAPHFFMKELWAEKFISDNQDRIKAIAAINENDSFINCIETAYNYESNLLAVVVAH